MSTTPSLKWVKILINDVQRVHTTRTTAGLADFWKNNWLSGIGGGWRSWEGGMVVIRIVVDGVTWIVIHEIAHGGLGKRSETVEI
jgi:hypothetical protein